MQIVILDKATTTVTDDINFSEFGKFGKVEIYDNLTNECEVIEATKQATVVVLNKVILDAKLLSKLSSSVKLIAITATGYDNVDVKFANQLGILVCNTPGYGTNAVAQLAMMLILSCSTQLIPQVDYLRSSGWNKQAGLSIPMQEIAGKTLGILGLGAIGCAVAKLALAFGMKVIAYNRTPKTMNNITMVSLDELACESDFISLSCALGAENYKIINADFLSKMKVTAYLINTARGGLIDESALLESLQHKQIAGAALDVLAQEPPLSSNQLLQMNNVILTPHIGWAPLEARQRCIDITVENIKNFINGTPSNLIN